MRLYELLGGGGKYVSVCKACDNQGACSPGSFDLDHSNLVESGTVLTQT